MINTLHQNFRKSNNVVLRKKLERKCVVKEIVKMEVCGWFLDFTIQQKNVSFTTSKVQRIKLLNGLISTELLEHLFTRNIQYTNSHYEANHLVEMHEMIEWKRRHKEGMNIVKVGYCECCKKLETLSLFRGWYLCWDCTDKFYKKLGIQP